MYTQMLTSKKGGELISFKVNGEEKIHQGEQCTIPNSGKTKEKSNTNWWKNL